MTEPQLEELISAYLDGELTGEEQTRVERLLDSDATARSLADELRALSSTLQALPQHRLPEDLSASILAQADATIGSNPPDDQHLVSNRPSGWRGLVWAAMAIAASLALLLFNSGSPVPELAKNSKTTAAPADREAAPNDWAEEGEMLDADASLETSERLAGEKRHSGAVMKSRAAPRPTIDEIEGRAPESKSADQDAMRHRNFVRGGAGANAVAGKAGSVPPQFSLAIADHYADFGDALFVQVNIKESAARSGAFSQLLVSQNIAWEAGGEQKKSERSLAKDDRRDVAELKKKIDREKAIRRPDVVDASGTIEVVLVEASPEQIEQTLSQIEARTQDYAGYEIEPKGQDSYQRESSGQQKNPSRARSYYVQSRDLPVSLGYRSEIQGGRQSQPNTQADRLPKDGKKLAEPRPPASPVPLTREENVDASASGVSGEAGEAQSLREAHAQQKANRRPMVPQSRAYFVLRIVPDNIASASKMHRAEVEGTAKVDARRPRFEGAPPEPDASIAY